MNKTFVDVHVLQTVPPSNVNRDDTGSPKTAVYGGVRRARVSSQSWKRATRKAFESVLERDRLGVRTKRVVALVAEKARELDLDLDEATATAIGEAAIAATGIKVTKPRAAKAKEEAPPESSYLVFLSARQVENLARLGLEAHREGGKVEPKQARAAADQDHSVDLALFGRMVADDKALNVDASCQVAHAISVHAVDSEYDYFTAVDDKAAEDEPGAGMIGTVEFNSSTLYRYATVDVSQLRAHLGDDEATAAAVAAFVRSFVLSMPTGKQNTFANRTLPEAVLVAVREDQPVNLVGAFEDAVVAREGVSRAAAASEALATYAGELDRAYGHPPVHTYVVRVGASTHSLASLGEEVGIDELVDRVAGHVRDRADR